MGITLEPIMVAKQPCTTITTQLALTPAPNIIPVLTPNSRQEGGTRPQDPTGERRGGGGRQAQATRGGAEGGREEEERAAGLERPLARGGRTIITTSPAITLGPKI